MALNKRVPFLLLKITNSQGLHKLKGRKGAGGYGKHQFMYDRAG